MYIKVIFFFFQLNKSFILIYPQVILKNTENPIKKLSKYLVSLGLLLP